VQIGSPFLIQVNLTTTCPLKCRYCYLRNISDQHLVWSDLEFFLNNFVPFYQKKGLLLRLNLTGGDLFFYPDLHNLINYIVTNDHINQVALLINSFWGREENYRVASLLRKKISAIQLNTDVATKEDVLFLASTKITTVLKIMLSSSVSFNKQLAKILYLKRLNNQLLVSVDRFVPQSTKQISGILAPHRIIERIKQLTSIFGKDFIAGDFWVNYWSLFFRRCPFSLFDSNYLKTKKVSGCIIPNGGLAVYPNGEIKLCSRISFVDTGFDLKNFDLVKYVTRFRNLRKSMCGQCALFDICGGGCLATYLLLAKIKNKDKLFYDPICFYKLEDSSMRNIMPEKRDLAPVASEVTEKKERLNLLDHYQEYLLALPARFRLSLFDLEILDNTLALIVSYDLSQLPYWQKIMQKFGYGPDWLRGWQKIVKEKDKRKNYYSLGSYHYRQRDPRGCSVSCYLMALSALKKGKRPSRAEEQKYLRLLTSEEEPLELIDLVQQALKDGLAVEVLSERDYRQEKLEGDWEKRRKRYVASISRLEGSRNFVERTGIRLSEKLFLKYLKVGKPILVNGTTEEGFLHTYLLVGYRRQRGKVLFLVSNPLSSHKEWLSFSDLSKFIHPPMGGWAMVLSLPVPGKRELFWSQLKRLYAPLDSFSFGQFLERVDDLLVASNIPYVYLPSEVRQALPEIVDKQIRPRLQEFLRRGKQAQLKQERISFYKDSFDPEKMSLKEFWQAVKRAYLEKINLHKKIALLLARLMFLEDKAHIFEQLDKLLVELEEIEARFFALSSRVKDFISYWSETVLDKRVLNKEEKMLFLTPSLTAFPLQLAQVIQRLRQGDDSAKMRALSFYFNLDPEYLADFVATKGERFGEVKSNFHPDTQKQKKLYLLLERKIPGAQIVEQLLVLDNYFDKFLEMRFCFLHDLFARVVLERRRKGLSLPQTTEEWIQGVEKVIEGY